MLAAFFYLAVNRVTVGDENHAFLSFTAAEVLYIRKRDKCFEIYIF